jgi:hypothetical protein
LSWDLLFEDTGAAAGVRDEAELRRQHDVGLAP